MKKIIVNFEKKVFSSQCHWRYLKNIRYVPDVEEKIVFQKGELEIKYTRNKYKVYKQIIHRHLDTVKIIVEYPISDTDHEAFDYFKKQDQKKPE